MGSNCPLTKRQLEILHLSVRLATTSSAELASHTFISVTTVDTHWSAILERTGTHSRVGATLVALNRGWITSDDNALDRG